MTLARDEALKSENDILMRIAELTEEGLSS